VDARHKARVSGSFDATIAVMAGLVPAIHAFFAAKKDVDGRDKRGHDDWLRGRSYLTTISAQPDGRGTRPGMTKECQRHLV
jgi:hypothetical protein